MSFPVNGGYHASVVGAPMHPKAQFIRPTPGTATRSRRPVLTDWLGRAVQLPKRRRTCTPEVVWRVILFAAAFARSLGAACAAIVEAPSGQAIWNCLYLARSKRRRALARRLLPALHAPLGNRDPVARVAIDYHQIAYFGEPNRDTTRSTPTAGTHTFHTYATACIVDGSNRYTLGLTAVGHKEPMTAVLARLLDQVTAAGVTIRVALLDEAFFSIAVMQLLQSRNLPFVIPAVIRGRKPRPGMTAVGLRALRKRGAGRYPYTHEDRGESRAGDGGDGAQELPPPEGRTAPQQEAPVRDLARGWRPGCDPGSVPEAVRDREQLPAVGPGAPAHLDDRWGDPVVVGGRGTDPAQRLGPVRNGPDAHVDAGGGVPVVAARDLGNASHEPKRATDGPRRDDTSTSANLKLLESV